MASSCLVYFLLEHQSEPDGWMPLRLYEYFGRIWSAYVREHTDAKWLPPIVGVVVHHGEAGWTQATSMHEIVRGIETMPELAAFVPSFEFRLDDLSCQDDGDLQRRPMALFARVALWLLRDGRHVQRFLDRLDVWGPLLDELAEVDPYGADIVTVVTYVLRVAGDAPAEIIRQRVAEVAPRLEEVMTSAAEQLIQQGLEKGRQEGLERGREEGRRSARIQTLCQMLSRRFGPLSPEQTQRIEGASSEQLDGWIERILEARSIDETIAD